MEDILALIGRAHEGDKEARDTLVKENMGLVYSIVRRFLNRGVEQEDLIQIGSIGLLKAIDKFNMEFKVKFSTYAVPMITGEIKRFLRDDGMIKVSRSLKETAVKAYAVREELVKRGKAEPSVEEISKEMGIAMDELVMAMEAGAQIESLQKTIYQGEGNDILLEERIEEKENGQERVLNRIFLEEALGRLEAEEREFIYMRFFLEKTQTQIAALLKISQVQVSRMEKKILKRLKDKMNSV